MPRGFHVAFQAIMAYFAKEIVFKAAKTAYFDRQHFTRVNLQSWFIFNWIVMLKDGIVKFSVVFSMA